MSFTLPSTRQIFRWKLLINCSSISKNYSSLLANFLVASDIVHSYTPRYLWFYMDAEYRSYTNTTDGKVAIAAVEKWSMERLL